MHILGVSCYYQDAAAALFRDGQLGAAAEKARFSRVKHDFGYPVRAIRFCLREGKMPRNPEMKDIVNAKIKFREPCRPFAPPVAAECATKYFELGQAPEHYPARSMLYVTPAKAERRAALPAITHVDGTARLQTVFQEHNPLYYGLIRRFAQATGVPFILNTAFNLRGEPIVNTPESVFSGFPRSEMNCLVLENFLIEKQVRISCQSPRPQSAEEDPSHRKRMHGADSQAKIPVP